MKSGGCLRVGAAAILGFLFIISFEQGASANGRTGYLIRLLQSSDAFRVRVQAALSLGRVEGDPEVVRALSDALSDDHPAVRTAAAASLERLADPSALPALKARQKERDAGARRAINRAITALERVARTRPRSTGGSSSGRATRGGRFYVGVGVPGAVAGRLDRATLERTRAFLVSQVRAIDGVQIAPPDESRRDAERVLSKGSLSGFYLDSSITKVEQTPQGLRVAVSIVINTYPGRSMRAMLNGAATVPGGSGDADRQLAIEGAIRSALRRLPQALEASAGRP